MIDKEIFEEKITDNFDIDLIGKKHEIDSSIMLNDKYQMVVEFLQKRNWNFLGIAKPPYNTYGKEFDFAFIIEDINNDYEIRWHHVSRRWLNNLCEDMNIEKRF